MCPRPSRIAAALLNDPGSTRTSRLLLRYGNHDGDLKSTAWMPLPPSADAAASHGVIRAALRSRSEATAAANDGWERTAALRGSPFLCHSRARGTSGTLFFARRRSVSATVPESAGSGTLPPAVEGGAESTAPDGKTRSIAERNSGAII